MKMSPSKYEPNSLYFNNIEEHFGTDEDTGLNEKLQKFYEKFRLPPEEVVDRNEICKVISEVLKPYFPECQVAIFGATANGFGIAGCRLDLLFIPYPGFSGKLMRGIPTPYRIKKKMTNEIINANKKIKEEIPDPKDVTSGKYPPSQLLTQEEYPQLLFVRNVLRGEKDKFKYAQHDGHQTNSLSIQTKQGNYKALLSTRSRLVLHNAQLLDLYGRIDSRVRPLVIVISYWSKCLRVVQPHHLSSYAMQLLVIFFLQNTTPPILPSLSYLHKHSGSSETVDGCEVSITKDLKKIPKTKNTQSLEELLVQFFQFYWNFDFARNVVSPHIGRLYPIKEMKKNPFFKEFKVSVMCIQDPFQLKCNVANNVFESVFARFKRYFGIALSHIKESSRSNVHFKKLFHLDHYKTAWAERFYIFPQRNVNLIYLTLEFDVIQALEAKNVKNLKEFWFDRCCDSVYQLLAYGMLIDCHIVDKVSFKRTSYAKGVRPKYVKEQDERDESISKVERLMSIQCCIDIRSWFDRNQVPTPLTKTYEDANDFDNPIIRQEYSISRHLVDTMPKYRKPYYIVVFSCDLYRCLDEQITDVTVVLTPLTASKEYDQLVGYLSSYLNRMLPRVMLAK